MKKVMILALLLAVVLGGGTVFASGKTEGTTTTTTQGAKITFWSSHTPPDSITLKQMVDTFNSTNKQGITVDFVQVPGSETDIAKLMTAVRGGTGPDVYMLDRFTVAQRASAGVLEDLSDLINKMDPTLSSKYLPFAWQETQFNGKTYALPFDTDARVLYYNKDMIQAAGYDPATFGSGTLGVGGGANVLTLDQVREIAMKIDKTDSSGQYTQVGFIPYDTVYSQGWHYTWGFDFGGKFADLQAWKVTPTDPGVVAAFQFAKDWAAAMGPQKAQTFISTYSPPNNPPEQHPFLTGKVAMMVNGDWMLASIQQYAPKLNYGVTYIPVPKAGDKPTTWAGGWSMVIPTGSKNRDAAFAFLSWITGPEGQRLYTQGTSHLPTYAELLNDNSLFTGNHIFFKDLLPIAKSRPPLPVGALYWDSLTQAWNAVTLEQADPMTALQKVYDDVQPQLDQFKPK